MNMSIERQMRALIARRLGIPEERVARTASFQELGADSLASMQVLMAIEDEFQVDIPDEDAVQMTTVQEFIDYVVLAPSRSERQVH